MLPVPICTARGISYATNVISKKSAGQKIIKSLKKHQIFRQESKKFAIFLEYGIIFLCFSF